MNLITGCNSLNPNYTERKHEAAMNLRKIIPGFYLKHLVIRTDLESYEQIHENYL